MAHQPLGIRIPGTKAIALSCVIKMSAACSFVSPKITHLDRLTNRQNYDPHDRVSIAASSAKTQTLKYYLQFVAGAVFRRIARVDTRDTCVVSRYFVLLRYTAVYRDLGDTGIVA